MLDVTSADALDHLAFIDLETTGLDPVSEEIVEVGVCFVERGRITARRSWLFKPSKPLPAVITALTGLTDDDLATAPPLDHKRREVEEALVGWTLVAHNASFERSFLGPLVGKAAFIDSCEVMHLLYPELPSHALDSLVRWAGLGEGSRHRALDDAEDTWLVLRTAFERVSTEGRREGLERLVRRLSPPSGPDAAALVQVLAALSTHCGGQVPPTGVTPRPLVDEALVGRFVTALKAGQLHAVDVERPALSAVLEAARRVGEEERARTPIIVAVPRALVREAARLATYVPRAQACRTRLAQLIETTAESDAARMTRAWLEAWAERSPEGDVGAHSGWMGGRLPETRVLLEQARSCTCHDPSCFVRKTERASDSAGVLVVEHELALDWLARGAPMRLVVVGAEGLPDAERRRTSVQVDARRVRVAGALAPASERERLAKTADWLERALRGQDLTVGEAERRSRTWLDVRDLLLGLQKDLAQCLAVGGWNEPLASFASEVSRVLGVVAAPFELRLQRQAVCLGLTTAPEVTRGRFAGQSAVLVSGVKGGASWVSREVGWVPPELAPWSLEVVERPMGLEEVARLAVKLSRDSLVSFLSRRPVEELAGPFRELPNARYRLVDAARALRGAGVVLGRWPGRIPAAANVVLYDLEPWRPAVLACGARHLTLASPRGLSASECAELADMAAMAGVRRLVPRVDVA